MAGEYSGEQGANRLQYRQQMLDMGKGLSLSPVSIAHEAGPGRHKGQIGDRSSHQELEESLRPPDIAGLAYAELHQPGQPMFGDLT